MRIWVWQLDPASASGGVPSADVLSDEERARASRIVMPHQGARFTMARAGLRHILGQCVGRDPAGLTFGVGPHGKPYLADMPHIAFNLSHSDDLAALAVTGGMPVGIDIERIRPVSDGLAARFFAPAEAAELDRIAQAERLAAFHACWTRKEAYIKALGTGFTTRLDSFAVSLDLPARLLWVAGDADAPSCWQMHAFTPADGFAGTVAAPCTGWEVVRLEPPWLHHATARASR